MVYDKTHIRSELKVLFMYYFDPTERVLTFTDLKRMCMDLGLFYIDGSFDQTSLEILLQREANLQRKNAIDPKRHQKDRQKRKWGEVRKLD